METSISKRKWEFRGTSLMTPVTFCNTLCPPTWVSIVLSRGSSAPKHFAARVSERTIELGSLKAVLALPFTRGKEKTSKNEASAAKTSVSLRASSPFRRTTSPSGPVIWVSDSTWGYFSRIVLARIQGVPSWWILESPLLDQSAVIR